MPVHVVKQGECLSSIARAYGFRDYRTIWSASQNADLVRRRQDPNILLPGDRLFVPDKAERWEVRATDQRHTFVVGQPAVRLELVLQFDGEPLANRAYTLTIGAQQRQGTTDARGRLSEEIDPGETAGLLHLEDPVIDWELRIGHLDPVTEVSGVQARLNNVNHRCGDVDGTSGPRTRAALRQFQSRHGLKPTGAIDAATSSALRRAHDQS